MSAAFKRVGVDRNTTVVTVPIGELFIAAPNKCEELLKNQSVETRCVFPHSAPHQFRRIHELRTQLKPIKLLECCFP